MDTLALGPFEIKSFSFEKREIEGIASTSHRDLGGDVVKIPGAFTKTLAERGAAGVELRVNHDYSALPIGSMVTLEERSGGLFMKARVYETVAGSDLLATIRQMRAEGKSVGLSIGYSIKPGGARFDVLDGKRVRVLEDIDLREISVTTTPMNPNTNITAVKSIGGAMYGVRKKGDAWVVTKNGDDTEASYDSEDAARAAADKLAAAVDGGAGKTVSVNSLPDSAFLYVAPGGVLDDEGKTVPRTNRHFRFRDAAGALDRDALADALTVIPEAKAVGLGQMELGRLLARARTLLESAGTPATKTVDATASEWQTGVPIAIRGVGYRLIDLSEQIASELKAMALLGEDTKSGQRMRAEMRHRVTDLSQELREIVELAERATQGEDGRAKVALYARELEMLGV